MYFLPNKKKSQKSIESICGSAYELQYFLINIFLSWEMFWDGKKMHIINERHAYALRFSFYWVLIQFSLILLKRCGPDKDLALAKAHTANKHIYMTMESNLFDHALGRWILPGLLIRNNSNGNSAILQLPNEVSTKKKMENDNVDGSIKKSEEGGTRDDIETSINYYYQVYFYIILCLICGGCHSPS